MNCKAVKIRLRDAKISFGGSNKGDFDGDGQAGLLFQDEDGFLAALIMNGTSLSRAGFLAPNNVGNRSYRVVATGDFNQDGNEDILFQHIDGTLAAWNLDGVALMSSSLLEPPHPGDRNWRVAAVGQYAKPFVTTLSGAAERPSSVISFGEAGGKPKQGANQNNDLSAIVMV